MRFSGVRFGAWSNRLASWTFYAQFSSKIQHNQQKKIVLNTSIECNFRKLSWFWRLIIDYRFLGPWINSHSKMTFAAFVNAFSKTLRNLFTASVCTSQYILVTAICATTGLKKSMVLHILQYQSRFDILQFRYIFFYCRESCTFFPLFR